MFEPLKIMWDALPGTTLTEEWGIAYWVILPLVFLVYVANFVIFTYSLNKVYHDARHLFRFFVGGLGAASVTKALALVAGLRLTLSVQEMVLTLCLCGAATIVVTIGAWPNGSNNPQAPAKGV